MTTPTWFSRGIAAVCVCFVGVSAGACAAASAGGATTGAAATTGATSVAIPVLDSARLLGDLFRLSHDSMGGRPSGSAGNAKARAWLVSELKRIGLEPVAGAFEHPFASARRNSPDSVRGVNVLGMVRGRSAGAKIIVVSAHYDHVPVRNGQIYNGADDNASGTAAVLQMAAYFQKNRPEHTLLFALWDAEEVGLLGARAFVAKPTVPLASIVANVNLDMVARGDKGELYAAGASPYPQMRPVLESLVPDALVTLRLGHDSGGGQNDWTNQSDQGAFNAVKIPFVYFGVEDHPDYHQPTDDPEKVNGKFYYDAARTIAAFVSRLDRAALAWPARN
ncbi:MAG: M20/M25/M40 family metallo-hydrolase [Gemmatimonadaceae bacterium]